MKVFLLLLTLLHGPLVVSSTQLWNDYHASQPKADQKYRDKELLVSGRLRTISASYKLCLDGGKQQVDGVTAVLRNEDLVKAGTLQVGQTVSLVCTGAGVVFGEPLLLSCKIP